MSLPPRPTGGLLYLPGFDGLRALSIAFVMAGHGGGALLLGRLLGDAWAARIEPLVSAETGVQVFFVLSGFLITRLLRDELRATGTVRLRRFYLRRVLRLTPPFAVFLLVVAGLSAAGALAESGRGLAMAALYVYNVMPREGVSVVLASTWSLAIEEQFYLVLPALLLAARARPALVLVGASLALLAVGAALASTPLDGTFVLDHWPTAVFPTLFAGCLAALAWERGAVPKRWLPWLVAAAVAYSVSVWAPAPTGALPYALRSVGVAVGVLWTVAHPDSRLVRVLEWAPLRLAGRLSYSLYLWQCLFLTTNPGVWAGPYDVGASYAFNLARAAGSGALDLLRVPPFNVLATVAAAVASYVGVERPALAWRSRVVGRRQAGASVASRP